ncbi:MAG TPA: hypothetical protein VE596_14065 [Gaiellaceae bacterium]|jgi:uncharacterized radical SAM superfamily Fe-S cluster-containing enzyme|nr:hypothetical protein [Gaiellaceae bacterium]
MALVEQRQKVDRDEVFLEYTKSICPVCKAVVDAEVNIRDNRVLLRSAAQSTGASRRSSTPTPSSTCASSASTSPAPSRSPTNGIRLAKDRRFVAELAPLKPDIYLQFDPTAGCGSGASRANRGRFSWGATDA